MSNNPLHYLMRGIATEFARVLSVAAFFICVIILIAATIFTAPSSKDCREGFVMIQGYCVAGYKPGKDHVR
jgi:hypothetical protein